MPHTQDMIYFHAAALPPLKRAIVRGVCTPECVPTSASFHCRTTFFRQNSAQTQTRVYPHLNHEGKMGVGTN